MHARTHACYGAGSLRAAAAQYYSTDGLPRKRLDVNVCAICARPLGPAVGASEHDERVVQLNCRHFFHEICIRGWCMIGKKDTCPYCKEKVDLRRMFKNPWEKQQHLYTQALDFMRNSLVWVPLLFVMAQMAIRTLDLT